MNVNNLARTAADQANPLVRMAKVSKRFGPQVVLDQLDLDLSAGECLGIIGPNGAGKTTTTRILL